MASILITGGCGFIGSNLAITLAAQGHRIAVVDNLSRRGSEVILRRIQEHGIAFHHGDIRNREDLARLPDGFETLIECSAEPSVMAGARGDDARRMISNNLSGAIECFEFAREREMAILFLSTSRVYPYTRINDAHYDEMATRYVPSKDSEVPQAGIPVSFPLDGSRSLYGATKLAGELLLQEYGAAYSVPSLILRCGVVAGPWQLGKVDQGVFTFWLASHHFGRPLSYIGFDGKGKQVRDLMHVDDLGDLVTTVLPRIRDFRGSVFNAGGSLFSSLSLIETTALCREITGRSIAVGSQKETRPADVIWYVTDNAHTTSTFGWKPKRDAKTILADTHAWMSRHEDQFRSILSS